MVVPFKLPLRFPLENLELDPSVRLTPLSGEKSIWEQDRPLLEDQGRVEMRGGIQIPNDAPPGVYGLNLVVYQTETVQGSGATRIARSSDTVRVGEIQIS